MKRNDETVNARNMPVMQSRCPSCPFRPKCKGGKTQFRETLLTTGFSDATTICHSTGDSDVVPRHQKLHRQPRLCRGLRNVQRAMFFKLGFIEADTDEAWNKKRAEMGV